MKNLIILSACVILTACGSVASPQLINGKYYMGGDTNCRKFYTDGQGISGDEILCADKNGFVTGKRSPMSMQEMQMYHVRQEQSRRQSSELADAFSDMGNSIANTNRSISYPTPTYTAPQLYTPSRINVNCNSVGNYTYCR